MRSVLCFLVVAATVAVCAGGFEPSLLSGKAILYESRKDVRQVTLTTDQLSALKVALVTFGRRGGPE